MAQADRKRCRQGLGRFERVAKQRDRREISRSSAASPLFSDFSREDVVDARGVHGRLPRAAGETIIHEGDVGDFMLLIVEARSIS